MKNVIQSFALLFAFAFIAGCSGAGSSGGGGNSIYRANLPTTTQNVIVSQSESALVTRYGYRFQRTNVTVEDVLFETEWRDQSALEDEQAQGYSFARTRITITARPRTRSSGVANTYSVRFIAETELRMAAGGDWMSVPMTPMRERYIKEIADYMKNEMLRMR